MIRHNPLKKAPLRIGRLFAPRRKNSIRNLEIDFSWKDLEYLYRKN